MVTIAHFLGLAILTVFAAAAAVALDWLFLEAAFRLMRPATAKPAATFRSELVYGTRRLARHFGSAAVHR